MATAAVVYSLWGWGFAARVGKRFPADGAAAAGGGGTNDANAKTAHRLLLHCTRVTYVYLCVTSSDLNGTEIATAVPL